MLSETQLALVKEMAVRGRTPKLRQLALEEVLQHERDSRETETNDRIWALQDQISELQRENRELKEKATPDFKTYQERAEQAACSILMLQACIQTLVQKGTFPQKDQDSAKIIAEAFARSVNYDQTKKIAIIKEIRAMTGMGLKEAKDCIDLYMPYVAPPNLGILA